MNLEITLAYLWGSDAHALKLHAYESSSYPQLGIWQVIEGALQLADARAKTVAHLTPGTVFLSHPSRPGRLLNPGLANGNTARLRGCDCFVRLWNQIDLPRTMDWPPFLRPGSVADSLMEPVLRLVALQTSMQDTLAWAARFQKAKADLIDALVSLGPVNDFGRRLERCDPRLRDVLAYMWEHRERLLDNSELAKHVSLSESRFIALFRETFDCPPMQFHLNLRLAEGARLLRRSAMTLEEIAVATGFHSAFHFSRRFSLRFGISPGRFRHLQD